MTARAAADLRRLFHSINGSDSLAARHWFNGLEAAILGLSEFPARHPATPENPTLRHLLYPSQSYVYRIIFTLDEANSLVKVLHIRHGSQKPLRR
ncbi:plasmid stabilization system family protein [Asticcacaulis biprosthecium C19]|uniref:Plasmid stabilization system family protein n=1 Tax=Asticcacaulis biprosthecium C19 TaxID=715226 RepID=F4QHM1_9CAUL|nr:plasmid stabilization system family protein [Asticcacaulis biprosthecium C19]